MNKNYIVCAMLNIAIVSVYAQESVDNAEKYGPEKYTAAQGYNPMKEEEIQQNPIVNSLKENLNNQGIQTGQFFDHDKNSGDSRVPDFILNKENSICEGEDCIWMRPADHNDMKLIKSMIWLAEQKFGHTQKPIRLYVDADARKK